MPSKMKPVKKQVESSSSDSDSDTRDHTKGLMPNDNEGVECHIEDVSIIVDNT
jgi:hypothetical protein